MAAPSTESMLPRMPHQSNRPLLRDVAYSTTPVQVDWRPSSPNDRYGERTVHLLSVKWHVKR